PFWMPAFACPKISQSSVVAIFYTTNFCACLSPASTSKAPPSASVPPNLPCRYLILTSPSFPSQSIWNLDLCSALLRESKNLRPTRSIRCFGLVSLSHFSPHFRNPL